MNREEIKQLGIQAGISEFAFGLASEEAWQQVERFAALVAAAEREACAAICDPLEVDEYGGLSDYGHGFLDGLESCAEAIRARGQHE